MKDKNQQVIKITLFLEGHQREIDAMMKDIVLEFEEAIFTAQSKKIIDVYALPNNSYWVATNGTNVIGTIGLTKLTNENVVLKSMFVDKKYRGQGISNLLVDTLINWATLNNCKEIYLGTMSQFIAAQRFYEKIGFTKCTKEELPADLIVNPLDTIFYTKKLK